MHHPEAVKPGKKKAMPAEPPLSLLAFYQSVETESYLREPVPYATFADGILGNRFVDAVLASAREDRWIDL